MSFKHVHLFGIMIVLLLLSIAPIPYLQPICSICFYVILAIIAVWGLRKLYRIFLWRVGRRLAFSYLLIGVLPIPMVNFLLILAGYLIAGFFLRHLYQDAFTSFHQQLSSHTQSLLSQYSRTGGRIPSESISGFSFGFYRNNKKIRGDQRFPNVWPSWLDDPTSLGAKADDSVHKYFLDETGDLTIATWQKIDDYGVLGVMANDLEVALSEQSKIRVEIQRIQQPFDQTGMSALSMILLYYINAPGSNISSRELWNSMGTMVVTVWNSRRITWSEDGNQLFELKSGAIIENRMAAVLKSTPLNLFKLIRGESSDIDRIATRFFIGIGVLLFFVYSLAVIYALSMIFGLSRAVNQLSHATTIIQNGDFRRRIPVRRSDQLGALHVSFNEMTAHLEEAVAMAAQKEIMESELRVARSIQKSLLPDQVPHGERLDFATVFEPSSAIGGDYFDIFRFDKQTFVIVIADVSGHGLPAGLRMVMLKAALMILIEGGKTPIEILHRLDAMVRSNQTTRVFVSMTIAVFNIKTGLLELTNAGHPPTYIVRNGKAEEILLPSSPLGGIGANYIKSTRTLLPDDVVVWLSDGLVEAVNPNAEPFGYDRVRAVLSQPATSAAGIRDKLVQAVTLHTQGVEFDDDRTMVVMQYRP